MAAGEEILAMIKEIKEQTPEKMTECPVCSAPLEEHPKKGLHCRFCGWTEH